MDIEDLILYVSYKWKGDKETILKILRKEKIKDLIYLIYF